MAQYKFVLDVNVWVSYILQQRLKTLTYIIIKSNLEIYVSPSLLQELEDVLQHQKIAKYLTLPVSIYLSFIENLATTLSPELDFQEAPDPKDNYLFDLAVAAGADYLVTGDKKLLEEEILAGIRIIGFRSFRDMFEGEQEAH